MLGGRRVVVCTAAGRRRFMPLVSHYIHQARPVVDEWRLWCNTQETEDVKCLEQMAKELGPFVTIQKGQSTSLGHVGELKAIRSFYTKQTIDADTVYIRVDDDICWMHPDAIKNIVQFRIDNPEYFVVAANMVNSGLCSHLNMRCGAHPDSVPYIPWTCEGGPLWRDHKIATLIHHKLLADIKNNTLDRWMGYDRWELHEHVRFGVAFCCFFGKDILDWCIDQWEGIDDEQYLSEICPHKNKRINCLVGNALIAHFGYGPQRDSGLEHSITPVIPGNMLTVPCQILNRYRDLAGVPLINGTVGKLNG